MCKNFSIISWRTKGSSNGDQEDIRAYNLRLGPVLLKSVLLHIYRKEFSLCGKHGQEPQYCVFKHNLTLWEVHLSLKPQYPIMSSMRPATHKRCRALLVTRLDFEEETVVLVCCGAVAAANS